MRNYYNRTSETVYTCVHWHLHPVRNTSNQKNTPPQHSKTFNKKVRLLSAGVLKRVRFIFWSQNSERRTTKRYDLYFGAKIPESYDYSTRYDYSASAGKFIREQSGVERFLLKKSPRVLKIDHFSPKNPVCGQGRDRKICIFRWEVNHVLGRGSRKSSLKVGAFINCATRDVPLFRPKLPPPLPRVLHARLFIASRYFLLTFSVSGPASRSILY